MESKKSDIFIPSGSNQMNSTLEMSEILKKVQKTFFEMLIDRNFSFFTYFKSWSNDHHLKLFEKPFHFEQKNLRFLKLFHYYKAPNNYQIKIIEQNIVHSIIPDGHYVLFIAYKLKNGYLVENKNTFITDTANKLILNYQFTEDQISDKCYIYLSCDNKLGVQEFRKYLSILKDQQVNHCMFISNSGATSSAMNELNILSSNDPIYFSQNMDIEIFSFQNLARNLTHHMLYHKHVLCSEDEVQQIFQKYNINKSNASKKLPQLSKKEPVCRYFNFQLNDLIRITRNIGNSSPYFYYRIVVP